MEERGSSFFDVFSGFRKKMFGGKERKILEDEEEGGGEIELGDIYGGGTENDEEEFTAANPMAATMEAESRLNEEWEERHDENTGNVFCENSKTGETSWEKPS